MFNQTARNLALIGLAALAAGCATTNGGTVASWPSRAAVGTPAPAAPPSGILFKLNVDADMKGLLITQVDVDFPRLEQIEAKASVDEWQRLVITGDQLNKFPNDVVLLPLVPGNYFAASSGIMYRWGTTNFVRATAGGSFEHFIVPPGKVVDLGALDISLKATDITKNAAGLDQRGVGGTCTADNTTARKLEVAEAALARPEVDKLGWRDALEGSRDDVLEAGDFGDEFLLKSWPSRVPATGKTPHPATGVLFRLNIDDSGAALPIRRVVLYFPRADQLHDSGVTNFQKIVIPGDQIHKFPNDLILVALSPGTHAADLLIEYQGSNNGAGFRLWDDFEQFDVVSGKITVLEDVDLKFRTNATTGTDGKPATQWHVDTGKKDAGFLRKNLSQTPAAKDIAVEGRRRAVEAALARPEAGDLKWRVALEAAKESLAQ